MRTLLLVSSILFVACSGAPQPAPVEPAPQTVDTVEPAPSPVATSCGEIARTNDNRCPSGADDAVRCFVDAVNGCRAGAVLDESGQTIEGGTVRFHYEVVASGSGCNVVRTTDWREDRFSGGGFTRGTCASATAAEEGGCLALSTASCGEETPLTSP